MAFRLYFVPKIWDATKEAFLPKYFAAIPGPWHSLDYDDWYVVGGDLSASDHTAVSGQADVLTLPANLDATLTAGQVTTTQNALEAANLPAEWVSTAFTWRQVMRIVCGIIQMNQRFKGRMGAKLFGGGITLNSTVGDLPANVRQKLQEAAESFGLDTSGVTLQTTLRAVWRNLGTQLQARPITFGEVTL